MSSPQPEIDPLLEALRADLPSASDERRVRARLLAAGVAVTAATVAPGAAAAAGASGAPVAFLQKLGALSWLTKVGVAGVVAAAVPGAVYLASDGPRGPVVETTSVATGSEVRPVRQASTAVEALPAAPPNSESEPDTSAVATATRDRELLAAEKARVRALPSTPKDSAAGAHPPPSSGASAAAFPLDPASPARAEGTLREETALVERALYALKQGDRETARRVLEEHRRRFPNGHLARERERALSRANDASGSAAP